MNTLDINGLTCFSVESMVASSPLSEKMNHLILESDPTPDYYAKNNFPPNIEHIGNRHLYLLVRKSINCFQDVIYRRASNLIEKFGSGTNIYPGQMTFKNEDHQCIRLNLNNTEHLAQIISEFTKLGIHFFPNKKISDYSSFIFYKKYTSFIFIEDGVYQDEYNPNRYFFEIPKQIDFKKFKEGMAEIKNSCDYHLFDSLLVYLFYKNRIRDFISIYSKHCDKTRFGEFKKEIVKHFD